MEYKEILVPFLHDYVIKGEADAFRSKFGDDSLPVDIEAIIEFKLGINIIPSPGLQFLCDTDALISSDWRSIVVDNNNFSDGRYQNRLRFSFAHEIGHFILHKNIYESFGIKNTRDFEKLINNIPPNQYGYLEIQANKFANYLLIPREKLLVERNKEIKKVSNLIASGKVENKKEINSYLAVPLSKIFGVSEEAVEIALSEIND